MYIVTSYSIYFHTLCGIHMVWIPLVLILFIELQLWAIITVAVTILGYACHCYCCTFFFTISGNYTLCFVIKCLI